MAEIDDLIIQPAVERGVLVDYQGYFLGAFTWPPGHKPQFNKKPPKTPEQKLHLLIEEAALDPPSEKARWDFVAKVWEEPTEKFYVVDVATGRLSGGSNQWPDRLKALPPGKKYVKTPPPNTRPRKPLWDDEAGEWKWPTRVAIVDDQGVVQNVALENPLPAVAKIEVPPGWQRFDDLPTGEPFPTLPDGTPVGPGDRRRSGGGWERKPETPEPQGGSN